MLIFTNRQLDTAAPGAAALTTRFQPGADTLGLAQVQRGPAGSGAFTVQALHPMLDDNLAMHQLVPLFQASKPVLLYLHGNSNTPEACMERCARLTEIYGVEVLGFSWPSEGLLSSGVEQPGMPPMAQPSGKLADDLGNVTLLNRKSGGIASKMRRYRQAKMNAQDSTDALARLLRLLSTARLFANRQPLTVAAHSLGGHLLQYAIENDGAAEALGAAQHIALLAACCRADSHAGWVGKLHPKGKVFVTYNKGDSVLLGAAIADGQQTKLGTEPGLRMVSPLVRYVSFTNAPMGLGGHGYFVSEAGSDLPKAAKKLFGRIFASQPDVDLAAGEPYRVVYPLGCDASATTCYMAQDDNPGP